METGNSVTVADIRLPAISRHRTFEGTFDVAPPESGDFGYGIIMGIGMMDELGIDQSRTTKMITWGELETPMVGVVHAYVGQKVLKRYIILIFSNFTVSQN
jgi:hypothetical protein